MQRSTVRAMALAALVLAFSLPAMAQVEPPKIPVAAPQEKTDLNNATVDQIQKLPGLNEAFAKKIVDNRPFKSLDDLDRAGIPAATRELIASQVTFSLPTAPAVGEKGAKAGVPSRQDGLKGALPTPENLLKGALPTPEKPVTGGVGATDKVKGAAPTPETPTKGAVPTPENPTKGIVPAPANPVKGSEGATEQAKGAVPTPENPTKGTAPAPANPVEGTEGATKKVKGAVPTPEVPTKGAVPAPEIPGKGAILTPEKAKGHVPTPEKAAAPKGERPNVGEKSDGQVRTPPQKGMVWANEASKVYYKEGSRSYGKTADGKWMLEADAIKAGLRAAKDE